MACFACPPERPPCLPPCPTARQVLAKREFQFMGSLELERRHLRCLKPGQWLNDEVINYFLVRAPRCPSLELARADCGRAAKIDEEGIS